jgi:hypothetical protein
MVERMRSWQLILRGSSLPFIASAIGLGWVLRNCEDLRYNRESAQRKLLSTPFTAFLALIQNSAAEEISSICHAQLMIGLH